jgi:Zn-dependent peptidase ImmA (M78 family)
MQQNTRKYAPEELAEFVLQDHWNGKTFPTINKKVLNSIGLDVFSTEFTDENIEGALRIEKGRKPAVFLKKGSNLLQGRLLFTMAHELGHYMDIKYNYPNKLDQDAIITDYRRNINDVESYDKELFANQFAGCVLMPANIIADMVTNGLSKAQMLTIMSVSEHALNVRLKNLGYKN